jgi:hypothetical protein
MKEGKGGYERFHECLRDHVADSSGSSGDYTDFTTLFVLKGRYCTINKAAKRVPQRGRGETCHGER